MKVYVAARFGKKDLVLDIYKKLEELGHSIAYDWTKHQNIKPYSENREIALEYSENEVEGISNCDVFIFISDERGTTLPMEFGAALMLRGKTTKPIIYAVGEFNNKSPWFFNKLVERRVDVDEVLKELR